MVSGDISPNPGPNTSLEEARISETRRKCLESNIKIAHLNIRSIKNRNNFLLVKEALMKHKFDILTISETWLDCSITDAEIWIPGYNIYRLDRVSKVGGGVCVYTKDNFKISSLNDLSYIADSGIHMLWLRVQVGNLRSFLICTAYRPPNAPLNCFETEFSRTLVSALLMSKPIYILGDLNCNVLNTGDPACQALLNFYSTFNLAQLITQPTRITESSATLLDVILVSNKELIIESNVVPISISDHDLVYATLQLKKERKKPVYVNARSFRQYNPNSFLQDMSYAPWSVINVFDDMDDKLNAFNLILNNILDLHAPIKRVKVRSRHNPFITEKICSLMKTRDHWRKLARQTNDTLAWAAYRNFKKEVRREIRLAEQEHVTDQIMSNPNNKRSIWKTIRSCIPKQTTRQKSYNRDEKIIANEFNTYFTSLGQITSEQINSLAAQSNYDLTQPVAPTQECPDDEQFSFRPMSSGEIEYVIRSMPMNKTLGHDKIPIRVIKDSLLAILSPITSIVNASLCSTCQFPSTWKKAEVLSVLKEGDHEEAVKNRPISLLPVLSKVCKRSALNQLMPYLALNGRLSAKQAETKKTILLKHL